MSLIININILTKRIKKSWEYCIELFKKQCVWWWLEMGPSSSLPNALIIYAINYRCNQKYLFCLLLCPLFSIMSSEFTECVLGELSGHNFFSVIFVFKIGVISISTPITSTCHVICHYVFHKRSCIYEQIWSYI